MTEKTPIEIFELEDLIEECFKNPLIRSQGYVDEGVFSEEDDYEISRDKKRKRRCVNMKVAGPDISHLIEKIDVEWNFTDKCLFKISDFFEEVHVDIKRKLFERLVCQLISFDIPKSIILNLVDVCEKEFDNANKNCSFMGCIVWIYILRTPLIWYKNSGKKWPFYLLCGVSALYNIDIFLFDKINPSRLILRISNNKMYGDIKDKIYDFIAFMDFRDVSRKKLFYSKKNIAEIEYINKKINDFRSAVFHETRVIIYDKDGKLLENKSK